MNRYKNHNKYFQFIITIIVSMSIVIALCFCAELELLFRSEGKVAGEELEMANLSKFCTIDQLEKKLQSDPKNYMINIKLAQIYESLGEYRLADDYYRNALKLSERSNYALYSYALFCAKHNFYALSATLCEELKGNNKRIIYYKAKIYEQLGDNFEKSLQYEAAMRAYQVAYKYSKNIKDKKKFKEISKKYSQSYVQLADYYIENKNIDEAVVSLKNALEIENNDIAKYKLALIFMNIDEIKSEKYMYQVFKSNPFLVNPYIYNKLLTSIIENEQINGNHTLANYYSLRLSALKKRLLNVYLYKGDISIQNTIFKKEKAFFPNKQKYRLHFDIANNTKENISSLYFQFEIYVNSKKYIIEKKAITNANNLEAFDEKSISVELPDDIQFIEQLNKNDIIVKFFAKKVKKSPQTLIKIETIHF